MERASLVGLRRTPSEVHLHWIRGSLKQIFLVIPINALSLESICPLKVVGIIISTASVIAWFLCRAWPLL